MHIILSSNNKNFSNSKQERKIALSCGDVVLVFDRNTLSLWNRDCQLCSLNLEMGLEEESVYTHHVIDFVHADQSRSELEHVVA